MSRSSRELHARAQALIPGGCHTYAKGDDQFPACAPPLLQRGLGSHVWDVDGNEYIEYGSGLRAVTLGHAYPPVLDAVRAQLAHGTNFSRPSPIEGDCAERLLALLPAAEQVKFAKDGSTVVTAAVRLARAHTGRELVAICTDQPFFSYNDWFIGSTPMSGGIPAAVRALTVAFKYNDIDGVRALFDAHPGKIACVVLEPARLGEPRDGFLLDLQRLCREQGALFVLDEMITGFRWHLGGGQHVYGLDPDLSTFGKGMANGFSVSALVGKRAVMELGGQQHTRERVFLLSTTHGAETHAMAAAIATMEAYREHGVIEHLYRQGARLTAGVTSIVGDLDLGDYFEVLGRPCNLVFATRDEKGEPSQPFRTLFLQELIKRGVIAPSFVVSFSHTDDDIDATIDACREALKIYRRALDDGVERYLEGPSVKPVFRPYA